MLKLAIVMMWLLGVFWDAGGLYMLSNQVFSSDEWLNIKDFNSGESFYLWTTSSVKVA